MNRLQQSRILLIAAILLIVAFQGYWLNRLYKEEQNRIEKETGSLLRDVVYNLQLEKFKADTGTFRKIPTPNLFIYNTVNNLIKARPAAVSVLLDTVKLNGARIITIHRPATQLNRIPVRVENRKKPDSNYRVQLPVTFSQGRTIQGIADSLQSIDISEVTFNSNHNQLMRIPSHIEVRKKQNLQEDDTALLNKLAGTGIAVLIKKNTGSSDSVVSLEKDMAAAFDGLSPPKKALFEKEIAANLDISGLKKLANFTAHRRDSMRQSYTAKLTMKMPGPTSDTSFIRMITTGKALDDSISVKKLDSAYTHELVKTGIPLLFAINKVKDDSTRFNKDSLHIRGFHTLAVPVGFNHAYWYRAEFENPLLFILKKISPQILFSFFLVGFISLAFIFLYRNLLAQRKLTIIKNDFISNVTHELKTPIATVNVAIEALRNFGGLDNPVRTKEYLEISASELQRLSLLVDKVLRLSMFETQQISLQKESFDLLQLINDVVLSMRLQFEQRQAVITVDFSGENFMFDADKLHITSVIYNLLDNALKYSPGIPEISINLIRQDAYFELQVKDKGIGIAEAYRSKIFDRFFRVPAGNRHNTKGYGLGLSYVSHIVQQHHGFIEVESEPGKGSTFIVFLPFVEKEVIDFGKGRKLFRKSFKIR